MARGEDHGQSRKRQGRHRLESAMSYGKVGQPRRWHQPLADGLIGPPCLGKDKKTPRRSGE